MHKEERETERKNKCRRIQIQKKKYIPKWKKEKKYFLIHEEKTFLR